MADENASTSVTTPDSSPSGDGASTALATSLGGDQTGAIAGDGGGSAIDAAAAGQQSAALDSLDTGTPGYEAILDTIPTDDADLATQANLPHYQSLVEQRGQLRTLRDAVRNLQQLEPYRTFGPVDSIKPQLELSRLLFSPVIDPRTNARKIDPNTQTAYVTTVPFVEYLDRYSPGMPEQLLADLLEFAPLADDGVTRTDKLAKQVLSYWDQTMPGWWKQRYGVSDAQLAAASVLPEELAAIPSEFHEAYKLIPPSIRAAWKAYSEADQARMLADYKGKLDDAAQRKADQADKERQKAADSARFQSLVQTEQAKYFDQIRRERFGDLSQRLAKQVVFSTDAASNTLSIGEIGCVLWNLIDPDGRFISEEYILKPLGIKLDSSFDVELNKFAVNANDKVALELAGDIVRANAAEIAAKDAADRVMTKLSVIALQMAKKKGAQMQTVAASTGNALDAAAAARAAVGNGNAGSNGQQNTGGLPPGISPGSPEALAFIAQQTGFVSRN